MKNFLDDPDVIALYKELQNKKYKKPIIIETKHKPEIESLPNPKIFWGGEEVSDFIGDNDYGL